MQSPSHQENNLFQKTRPTRLETLLVILSSAICYFWGTGFNEIWLLAWVAPLPILWLGLKENRLTIVFISAFLAYFLGGLNVFYYLNTPLPVYLLIFGQFQSAIFFGIIILISCAFIKRTRVWYSVFVFPLAWVSYEFVNAYFSSAGTLDNLAYSQTSVLPIIQIASITGIWGISFLLALLPSSIAVVVFLRKDFVLSIGVPLSIFVSVFAFGGIQLSNSPGNTSIKVGLLTVPESVEDILSQDPLRVKLTAKRFIQEIPKLRKQNVQIVIMPEKIVTTTSENESSILDLFKKAAIENQVALLVGIREIRADKKYNTAFLISKDGNILTEYHKQHLLPGPESGYFSGKKINPVSFESNFVGFSICKDMDFIDPSQQYARAGIGVMFVPALDFVVDGWLHAKPAILRGVEGGYSVVRVAQWGLLTVSDAHGRVLAQKKASPKNPTYIVAEVPMGSGKSIYSQYGNWFAWLCGILLLILLGKALFMLK